MGEENEKVISYLFQVYARKIIIQNCKTPQLKVQLKYL